MRLKGRLKNLKPKHKSDFLKGCIFRWEDTLATDGKLHFKKNKAPVLRSNEQDIDREEVKATSVLKVYARDKAKKLSRNMSKPKMNLTKMDEVQEGLESDFEGINHLNHKSDFSSTTSSDSDETFLSDRPTEEDVDSQLQGISSLMEDSVHTANKDKQGLVDIVTPSNHSRSLLLSQSEGKDEDDKESSPLVAADTPRNLLVERKDTNGEWKNL